MYTLHSVPNKCKTVQIAATYDEDEFYVDIDKFKPILHPLSDFTKEIEHDGETFVPREQLNKNKSVTLIEVKNTNGEIEVFNGKTTNIRFFEYCIIEKIIEWHFDVANLIEKGEAIDVNTLDVNPYK